MFFDKFSKHIENNKCFWYNIFIKVGSAFVVLCTVLGGVLYFLGNSTNAVLVSAQADSTPSIIIDAGHGGFDGGAVAADGTVEKDINLSISKKLSQILKFNGFRVIMTRESDIGTDTTNSNVIAKKKKSDMVNRLKVIEDNSDSLYISIHLNKFTTSAASGAQVFYSPNNRESFNLGNAIQSSIKNMLQPENYRAIKKGTKSTYLLYNAKSPAVIVECGFLSNTQELKMLKTEDYQTKIAVCISAGILNYYGGNYGK